MRMPTFIALLGSAALLAGCAHHEREEAKSETREFVSSEPADVSPQKITRYADEDRDGFVTRKEAKADKSLAAAFDRYDLDDNDKLDRGEFARLEASRKSSSAQGDSHDATAHGDRWQVEKPDGYFGPERDSLNRTGARSSD
jgi:hypothetical protein